MSDVKRRRVKPEKYAQQAVPSQREEELYQQAVANSRVESQRLSLPIDEAPTYHPTHEEFLDPLAYIDSAEPYGICKVKPPDGWSMPCQVEWGSAKQFATKRQRIDRLQESLPYTDGGKYTLADYKQMADAFQAKWLRDHGHATDQARAPETDAAQGSSSSQSSSTHGDGATTSTHGAAAAAAAGNDAARPQSSEQASQSSTTRGLESESGGSVAGARGESAPAAARLFSGAALHALLEEDYWRMVDSGGEACEVEYGNDIDTDAYWSGFVKPGAVTQAQLGRAQSAAALFNSPEYFARSGWNLNNIARWPGSVLRHFAVPVPGVNSPWLYMGMLFSTFSWHNEDNYLSSINYNHLGASKQWYGVPGASSSAFENVVRRFYKQRLQEVPDLLHHMNTQFSPSKLKALGVPAYKLVQHAGEFVVTFPQAFHSGFSYGFNCGEAVNFATAQWIEHAKQANERYRRLGRLAVLGHDRLIFTLARYLEELDLASTTLLLTELRRLVREDSVLRARLYAEGVRDVSQVVDPPRNNVEVIDAAACDYDDKRVCAVCRHTCFLSAVACNCSQTSVSCLRHVNYLCKCPPTNKYLIEWESKQHLEAVVDAVSTRHEQLAAERPSAQVAAQADSQRPRAPH